MKRSAEHEGDPRETKKSKQSQAWQRSGGTALATQSTDGPPREIESGMTGIWATCAMGKEGLCVRELRNLFERYAEEVYDKTCDSNDTTPGIESREVDIEADIKDELDDIQTARSNPLFTSIRLDTQCLIFFQTHEPVEPVSFVHHICQDAAQSGQRKSSRFIQRITPITKVAKATENGLADLAKEVLAPHFHDKGMPSKKFAIRPNIRNHKVLSRDSIIQQVASAVGPGHTVDLKHYDLLILVEVYKNICGMSVVGSDYERLKRYNLSELHTPAGKSP